MSEIINYTRLTTSDKISDKFVTCQAYFPQDREKAELGSIFSQIEINSPWFPTSQIGQTIINTLIKEYYRGNDSSELVNFEEAVKAVNEALAHAAQSGETEWIGKLSGVLVLINRTDIHFAQTGKSHSYLYRSGKINHITEGLESEDAPHPLKTFSNLTSGTLQEDDKIIIANEAFFEVISPNELRLIITSLPPALAAIECAKLLQNHGSQDANAIFLELTSREKLADLLPEQKIEAVYLDQQILTIGAMSKNAFKNITHSIGGFFKSGSEKLSKFSNEKVKPMAKKGLELSREKSRQVVEKTKSVAKSNADKIDSKVEEISNNQGHLEKKNMLSIIKTYLTTSFTKIKNKIRRPLIKIGLYTQKKSKMYLILLVVVILALAGVIYWSTESRKSKASLASAEQSYNQMVSLSGEANILESKNQTSEALSKFESVLSLSSKLNNTKYAQMSTSLVDKANAEVAKLAKLTDLKPIAQSDLANVGPITYLDNNLIAIAKSDLFNQKSDSTNFVKLASLGDQVSALSSVKDLGILAGISGNKIVSFNSTGNEYKTSDLTLSSASMISTYGSNIYVSDPQDNKLWKITYSEGNFKEKSSYFKDDVSVAGITSYTIDGSVYTLSSSGAVTRYSRGSKVSGFNIELPGGQKVDQFISISTNEDSDYLLVLTKIGQDFRIIKIKKTGEFQNQYKLNGLASYASMSTNPDLSEIFVAGANKVFSYKLN